MLLWWIVGETAAERQNGATAHKTWLWQTKSNTQKEHMPKIKIINWDPSKSMAQKALKINVSNECGHPQMKKKKKRGKAGFEHDIPQFERSLGWMQFCHFKVHCEWSWSESMYPGIKEIPDPSFENLREMTISKKLKFQQKLNIAKKNKFSYNFYFGGKDNGQLDPPEVALPIGTWGSNSPPPPCQSPIHLL
jgi:hypothetical protein